jgi:release factor glutamine methyltransferase
MSKQKMTIAEALTWAVPHLQESCERPQFEAELLLAHHLGRDRLYLYTHGEETVPAVEAFQDLVRRREAYEPYAYITGRVSFYDIELQVAPGVLIPRPETELLIDRAAEIIERHHITKLVEIGVGSGAISIVLARKFPGLRIVATDISDEALSLAGKNIEDFGLEDQIMLLRSNLMDKVDMDTQMVVSNPPYIANDTILDKNVAGYEPHRALFGGRKGDELLRKIISQSRERGVQWLACEMGYDQRAPIQEFVNEIGVEYIDFYRDLAGLDRGFVIKFPILK